ncbi:MAG: hypothetical protein K2M46_04475 [Lachnospiraceae bacterium]|nr:hypothetical protein [Lachnospiraceae bacterium]
MERYEYLYELNSDELVKLIEDMLDFEEVAEAFNILESRNPNKALEKGKQIIEFDRGDEYLQATIWDIMFYENRKEMIDAVDRRKNTIGKTLLDDIIIDLTNYKTNVHIKFLKKIENAYMSVKFGETEDMRCDYSKFVDMYLNV